MTENGYYPLGTEHDPNAPYNQAKHEKVEVKVVISQTLNKKTKILITDYIAKEYENIEPDDEGGFYKIREIEYDFSDSDLKGAYEEQEYTIPELLDYLKAYLITDIAECDKESGRKKKLQHILECCEGWEVDETEVVED